MYARLSSHKTSLESGFSGSRFAFHYWQRTQCGHTMLKKQHSLILMVFATVQERFWARFSFESWFGVTLRDPPDAGRWMGKQRADHYLLLLVVSSIPAPFPSRFPLLLSPIPGYLPSFPHSPLFHNSLLLSSLLPLSLHPSCLLICPFLQSNSVLAAEIGIIPTFTEAVLICKSLSGIKNKREWRVCFFI